MKSQQLYAVIIADNEAANQRMCKALDKHSLQDFICCIQLFIESIYEEMIRIFSIWKLLKW